VSHKGCEMFHKQELDANFFRVRESGFAQASKKTVETVQWGHGRQHTPLKRDVNESGTDRGKIIKQLRI